MIKTNVTPPPKGDSHKKMRRKFEILPKDGGEVPKQSKFLGTIFFASTFLEILVERGDTFWPNVG